MYGDGQIYFKLKTWHTLSYDGEVIVKCLVTVKCTLYLKCVIHYHKKAKQHSNVWQ